MGFWKVLVWSNYNGKTATGPEMQMFSRCWRRWNVQTRMPSAMLPCPKIRSAARPGCRRGRRCVTPLPAALNKRSSCALEGGMLKTSRAKTAKHGKKDACSFQNGKTAVSSDKVSIAGRRSHRWSSCSTCSATVAALSWSGSLLSPPNKNSSAEDLRFRDRLGLGLGEAAPRARPRPRPPPRLAGACAAKAAPTNIWAGICPWLCKACSISGLSAQRFKTIAFTARLTLLRSSGEKTAWDLKRGSRNVAACNNSKPVVPSKCRFFVASKSLIRNWRSCRAAGCMSSTFTVVAAGLSP